MRLFPMSIFIPAILISMSVLAADAPIPPAPALEDAVPQPTSNAVQLSSDGLLPGVIMVADPATGLESPATELTVRFLQKGEIKTVAKPGIGGVFQAKGLASGRYAVIASGKAGYLVAEVEVVAPPPQVPQVRPTKFVAATARTQFRGLAVPPADLPMVLKLANSYVPPTARTAGPAPLVPNKDVLTADDLKSGYAQSGKGSAAPDAPYVVERQVGGKVLGQLHRFHPITGQPVQFHHLNAFLVQGNALPQKVLVASNGNFEFADVAPGHYSVVAAGGEGFMAFGLHVVEGQGGVASGANKALFVNVSFKARRAELVVIDGTVIDLSNFPEALRQLAVSIAASQGNSPTQGNAPPGSLGAGPGGGGGAGGGGAGAGGSGLGLLGAALGAAGLGLAAANGGSSPSSP